MNPQSDVSNSPSSEPSRSINRSGTLDQQRLKSLAEVDNAPFSRFHVKVCCVAGVGFFTDAYDIFAISIASTMLGYVYGNSEQLDDLQNLGVKIATPIGTLIGQLLFGWLADVLGRKKMYGFELMIIIVGTLTQAVAGSAHAVGIIGVLVMWRFIMGIGIGGDYPLSAIITSEFASTRTRGRLMTAVFAFQGWGQLGASIVSLIVTAAYKSSIVNIPIDFMWRIVIGLGCVPACIALYFRLTIPETPRFTMDIERNIANATRDIEIMYTTNAGLYNADERENHAVVERIEAPRATRRDFWAHFSKWKNGKVLLGCAWSWFVLDVAFYGLNLNTSTILQNIGFNVGGSSTAVNSNGDRIHDAQAVYNSLFSTAVGNVILSVAGLIPGYWVSFLFIDSWGRKPIQLMGFSVLTVLFLIMGFAFDKFNGHGNDAPAAKAFVFLYCLTNFFQNFGPNTTTFIIPGEVFPTRYRSTAHGISAASGKLGAVLAQLISFAAKNSTKTVLEVYAFFMLTGIASTLLLPETRGKSLEELSNEDQEKFMHVKSHTS
ncbi:MFS general substrate transporter [Dendrothele bispora CBS 962.96]|uniref:MFS general substrate transporter n=1 Tax=Dendrothele bispora (strain CBS 962.96) TaxID=1314807 RepID=A0A4S8MG82_DENBC|nr:MFS general substrate transporter [Dendrothele bispora CBS 962.96]